MCSALDHLANVAWLPLVLALVFHLLRRAARARAWHNIVRSAYPDCRLGYLAAFGACLSAVGVGCVSPVRGGEMVRLPLVKGRIEGSSYATLAATMVVESVVDIALATVLVSVSVGVGLLPALGGLAVVGIARAQLSTLRDRVRDGFAVVRDRRAFVRGVASWLVVSWLLRLVSVCWFLEAFGIDATARTAVVVVAIQCLSTLVPITWLGIGAQHGLLVAVLGGTSGAGSAIAFGLGMQSATLLVNLAVGAPALVLLARSARWRSLTVRLRLT